MNTCKKLLAALCVMALFITSIPLGAKAADTNSEESNYDYTVEDYAIITKYKGTNDIVKLPDKLGNNNVLSVGMSAFANNSTLRVLHSNITTKIGIASFSDCSSLSMVTLPSVVTIREKAFENCTSLSTLELNSSLTKIEKDAFLNCNALTKVKVPSSVTSFGEHCLGYMLSGTSYVVNPNFTIECANNSAAMQYAISNKIAYKVINETPVTNEKPENINDVTIDPIPAQTYTGRQIQPNVVVKYKGTTLKLNTDYTVSYGTNTAVGTSSGFVTITVMLRNGSKANKTIYFSIVQNTSLASATIDAIPAQVYTGHAITPSITVRLGSTILSSLTDYTVSYYNNTAIGTATIYIVGKGKYTGSQSTTFRIAGKNINQATISSIPAQKYTGYEIRPAITLKDGLTTLRENVDYALKYTNNIAVGTASITITGIGNYGGSKVVTFSITGKDLKNATVAAIPNQLYTGSTITPKPVVTYSGTTLRENIDYTLTYLNNINAGTATITIIGKGEYSGSISKNFTITKNDVTITASNIVLNYSESERNIKINAKVSNTDATLSYSSDNEDVQVSSKGNLTISEEFSGLATITIKAKLNGVEVTSAKITLRVPSSVRIISTKRSGNTTATIKWGKHSKMTGYVVQYAESSLFTTNMKEFTVSTNTTTSKSIKGLTKNQKYYVRVRTYYLHNGVKYYSNWSQTKTIRATMTPETMYRQYLNKQATKVEKILSYTLLDINGDGTKELLYTYYSGGARDSGAICTIINGKVKQILDQGGSPHFYSFAEKKNQIMIDGSNSAFEKEYNVYTMKNGKMKLLHKYLRKVNQNGKSVYYVDGKKIKKSEFTKMKNACAKIKLTEF